MPQIPEPQLVGDTLTAVLLRLPSGVVLALGALPPDLPPQTILRASGPLTIRYALAYLGRSLWIVPGLVATEYGGMLVGREAWDFAQARSNLHPRADVLGLRSDGRRDQVMFRELDFGQPVIVLAYETPEALTPLAHLDAYWRGPEAPPVPDLLQITLPALEQLADTV